jgi:Carboxypeptidase regulatory-like domain/TonB dependent receptor
MPRQFPTLRFLALLILGILPVCRLYAQVVGATLTGTVSDPTGAVIPNASISITNIATSVTREATTDAAGLYSAPNLLPGTYSVTISAAGFASQEQKNITLTVGATQVLNVSLQIGQATQKIEVSGAAATVELASSAISAVVAETTVRELPLNGRDWTQLATLQAGVSASRTQASANSGVNRGNRGFGNELSANGHQPRENNYRVDGININDYTNSAPGSVLGLNLGVDAIQEFSVLTTNYGAEYGRTSGAVINAITKSGTNSFHGDAYWFIRDEDFDARNFFDPAHIPPFHRNNFGASAGGPIKKDKTFIFGDYEGIRQDLSSTFRDTVPSQDARNGILHNADGTTTTITVDPAIKPYLPFWPLPNAGLISPGNTGFFVTTGLSPGSEDYATTRVDHIFSDRDSLAGSYFYDRASLTTPDALVASLNQIFTSRQKGGIEETHIFSPALVNTVRFGVNRSVALITKPVSALNPLASDTSLGTFPGLTAPNLIVPGLTTMQGSLGSQSNYNYWFTTIQFYDDASLTKGAHTLKFGFAFERIRENLMWRTFPTGRFQFPSLIGFLTNAPTFFQGANPAVGNEVGLRQSLVAGYLQDDWRLRSNLTLNLGVRYEFASIPTSANVPFQIIQNLSGGLPVPTNSAWQSNATTKDFQPRVGFSWDPFKNGKTAVRGGFGMFNILPLPAAVAGTFPSELPFQAQSAVSLVGQPAGSTFPTGVLPLIVFDPNNPNFAALRLTYLEPHPASSYALNWNLNVQRDLGWNTLLMIGYVGSHSANVPFGSGDLNGVQGTLTSAGYLWPFPVGSGTKLNPNAGQISGVLWDSTASYNSLQLQATKRMSQGFQAQAAYTWSRCIDDGNNSDFFLNSIQSLPFYIHSIRHGNCDMDQRQNFVFSSFWNLPGPRQGVAMHILGGWQLGGIVTLSTGSPFTPQISGDPLGQGNATPFDAPDRLDIPGCGNVTNPGNVNSYLRLNCFSPPVAPASFAAMCQPAAPSVASVIPNTCMNLLGNAGRNQIFGPGLADVDFSVFKNIRISERFAVQLRSEFFNLFNHANFAPPLDNSTLFTNTGTAVSGAGAIDSTVTTSRQIQFALKFMW